MKYVGPIDGHDQQAVENALTAAKNYAGPVIVHAITEKGHGYAPARANEDDQFHAVGQIDPLTGEDVSTSTSESWTSVLAAKSRILLMSRRTLSVLPARCSFRGSARISEATPSALLT